MYNVLSRLNSFPALGADCPAGPLEDVGKQDAASLFCYTSISPLIRRGSSRSRAARSCWLWRCRTRSCSSQGRVTSSKDCLRRSGGSNIFCAENSFFVTDAKIAPPPIRSSLKKCARSCCNNTDARSYSVRPRGLGQSQSCRA